MTKEFLETFLPKTEAISMSGGNTAQQSKVNSNQIRAKVTNNILKKVKTEADNIDVNPIVDELRRKTLPGVDNLQKQVQGMLGNLTAKACEIWNHTAEELCKSKNIVKKFSTSFANSMKSISEIINENSKAQYFLGNQTTLGSESSLSGWTECMNPLYEYNYGSRFVRNVTTSKTMKGSLLTLVVFGVTMVLTNIIRIQLGGTPAGQFGSIGAQWMFQFFTCLFIAPIIEEPAKMISIKGGYGKHFFFAFNLLEFGGYILMALHLGATAIGPIILARAVAVIFHAITMKIHSTARNQGPVGTTLKTGICILLHFMFNALAMKFAFMGIAGGPALLFIIGFMGVAYGLFSVARKGIRVMTGRIRRAE